MELQSGAEDAGLLAAVKLAVGDPVGDAVDLVFFRDVFAEPTFGFEVGFEVGSFLAHNNKIIGLLGILI